LAVWLAGEIVSETHRILVVDDEAPIREFITLALLDEGYDVVDASNGLRALETLVQYPPDLILLDLWMPIMSGQAFLEEYIRLPEPRANVIIMTAADDTLNRGLSKVVNDFIPKPFSLDKLLLHVKMQLPNPPRATKAPDILWVEDDDDDVEMLTRAMRKNNLQYSMKITRDGAEALDYLFPTDRIPSAVRIPKLILLDLKLPKISGFEILAQIRSNPRMQSVPVVIFTSSAQTEDIERSYAAGVNDYVVKPMEYAGLVQFVQRLGNYLH
jgi:two-component system, response regulator